MVCLASCPFFPGGDGLRLGAVRTTVRRRNRLGRPRNWWASQNDVVILAQNDGGFAEAMRMRTIASHLCAHWSGLRQIGLSEFGWPYWRYVAGLFSRFCIKLEWMANLNLLAGRCWYDAGCLFITWTCVLRHFWRNRLYLFLAPGSGGNEVKRVLAEEELQVEKEGSSVSWGWRRTRMSSLACGWGKLSVKMKCCEVPSRGKVVRFSVVPRASHIIDSSRSNTRSWSDFPWTVVRGNRSPVVFRFLRKCIRERVAIVRRKEESHCATVSPSLGRTQRGKEAPKDFSVNARMAKSKPWINRTKRNTKIVIHER